MICSDSYLGDMLFFDKVYPFIYLLICSALILHHSLGYFLLWYVFIFSGNYILWYIVDIKPFAVQCNIHRPSQWELCSFPTMRIYYGWSVVQYHHPNKGNLWKINNNNINSSLQYPSSGSFFVLLYNCSLISSLLFYSLLFQQDPVGTLAIVKQQIQEMFNSGQCIANSRI